MSGSHNQSSLFFYPFSTSTRGYEKALAIYRETSDRSGEARVLNNIGEAYLAFGDIPQALTYLRQALTVRRSIGVHKNIDDLFGEATTLSNIGGVYHNLGYTFQQTALSFYKQALDICTCRAVGDRLRLMEGTVLLNIAGVYDALGNTPLALKYLRRALTIHQEVGDREMESNARFSIALTYYQQGRIPEAIHELEKTVELERRIQHPNYEQDLARLTIWKKASRT